MRNVFEYYDEKDHLEHHGILGMKWGIRRYQNKDGSLTSAGRKRYGAIQENSDPTKSTDARISIYSKSSECKEILNKATMIQKEIEDEYSKWMSDPKSVKKSMAEWIKFKNWDDVDLEEYYKDAGMDAYAHAWSMYVKSKPDLEAKENKVYDLSFDFRDAAEHAFLDSNSSLKSSVGLLREKAGYDDYFDLVYGFRSLKNN